MIRRTAGVLLAAAALLASAGCSQGGGGDDRQASTSTTTTTTASDGNGTGATTTPRVDDAAGTTTGITVTLAADRLVVGGNALVLGAPEFQVRSYLERALLDPTKEGEQDCGAGRLDAIEWREVTAYLDDADHFVGWYADGPTLATDAGIRVGSTRTEVERAYPGAQVSETTLGSELYVPLIGAGAGDGVGLSGVFEGDRLAALWAGATCVAR